MNDIIQICLTENSSNPIEILEKLMSMPSCPMHGPIHHVLVGSALLTAFHNAGGKVDDLEAALTELEKRAKEVPGAACGLWGACGAGVSTGMFISIITKTGPLSEETWSLTMQMTSRALDKISRHGGPRCCKRDSYLAIMEAIIFTEEQFGIKMDLSSWKCTRSTKNQQCIMQKCPFYSKGE